MSEIDNVNDSDSEDKYRVSAVKGKSKVRTTIAININAVPIKFQIDSGADVNIIDEDSFSKLKGKVTLKKYNARLFAYNSTSPLALLHGKFTAAIYTKKRYDMADFYVVKGSQSSGCQLGSTSAMNLGILRIINQVKSKHNTTSSATGTLASAGVPTKSTRSRSEMSLKGKLCQLVASYDELFHSIGKIKGAMVKLHTDETVTPVAQKHRRVAELSRLEGAGIIETVDSATD